MDAAPARDTTPRIGEWMSEAIALFGKQPGVWLGQGAILFFIGQGPMLVGMAVYYAAFFGALLSAQAHSTPTGGAPSSAIIGAIGTGLPALFGGSCISVFLMLFFMAGMMRTAAKQLRGEGISVPDIFHAGDVYLAELGVWFVVALASSIGSLLCVVPGLVVSALWIFASPLVVEKRLVVSDALRESWETTKPHLWTYVLWLLLYSLVVYAGSMVVFGVIATFPIAIIMLMVSYRDVIGIPGALPRATEVRAAPPVPQYVDYGPAGPPAAAVRCPHCERPVAAGAVICPNCRGAISVGPTLPSWPAAPPTDEPPEPPR